MSKKCTYILHISYDGTDYFGWQKQPDVPTIQETIENALLKLFSGSTIKTTGSSRTDRGVHAEMQVVSFSAQRKYEADELANRLNKMLPHNIAIIAARCVDKKFSARFDSKGKIYRYKIVSSKEPLLSRYAWWLECSEIFSAKNIALLDRLAKSIIGEHNFSAFSIKKDIPDNPLCNIFNSYWEKENEKTLLFFIEGNRFFHKMVRSLVGAMLDVARGHLDEKLFYEMLETGERLEQYRVAPPQGLMLMKVLY